MKNACIVGYGNIGPVHALSLSLLDNAKFYAVCDINEEKIKKCKEKYNVLPYINYDDVLSDSNIDVVHICTPHYLHVDMAISAMKAGKDVVLEKPVGISMTELDRLYEFSKTSSQKLCIMFQNRENNCVKLLKKIVTESEKNILGVCGFLTWDRGESYYKSDEWRGKWKTEGGALMINQAIHLVDMMCYIGGKVESIKAHTSTKCLQDIIEAEDTAEMLMYFENGARGCMYATNNFSTTSPYRLEVVYDNITYRYADNFLYKIEQGKNPEILCSDAQCTEGKLCWGDSHQAEIYKFYANEDYVTLSDVYTSSRIIYAMYKSSALDGKQIII